MFKRSAESARKPSHGMQNEKDVGGKDDIEREVSNKRPTWSAAAGQRHEDDRRGQKEYESKKIKSSVNQLVQIGRPSMKHSRREEMSLIGC